MVKVEVEFSADPLWCKKCFTNLDIEEFSIPVTLVEELYEWVEDYGTCRNKVFSLTFHAIL